MKVAMLCELAGTARQGGEQHAMLRLAHGLSRRINVDVYSYAPVKNQKSIKTWLPWKLRLVPFMRDIVVLPLVGLTLLPKLSQDYDVIHSSSTTIAAFCRPKARFIVTCHIVRSQKFAALRQIPKYRLLFNGITLWAMIWLEKRSLKRTDSIIVIRDFQKDFLIDVLGVKPNKVVVIPNSVDITIFKPLHIEKKQQAIFVGRGTIPKGLDLLISCAEQVKGDILIVCQKIDSKLKRKLESKPNISLVLKADTTSLVRYYSESKVFVLPSRDETQPLTVLEAMACGLPVVVSRIAASDYFMNNICGRIVDPLSPSALASAINTFLTEDPHIAEKRNCAIAAKYSEEENASRTLTTYF